MLKSFYSSAVNAASQQEKLNVIANNMANLNTKAFKKSSLVFSDMLYDNIRPTIDGEDNTIKNGSGAKPGQINLDFSTAGAIETGSLYDHYIPGEGFFAIQDPKTGEVGYSRDGAFYTAQASDGKFYLAQTATGGLVLDTAGNPIPIAPDAKEFNVGVFTFKHTEGFLSLGSNLYKPVEKNGAPMLVRDIKPAQGKLEMSNASMSDEMANMILAQRTYQMNLKMLQASDEIIQDVNRWR